MRLPILMMSAFICAASASAETTIRFSNDWKWEGPAAPLLLALDRGWYAEAGLDVTMDTGQGSREAIPRVADGSNWQMGACDINSLVKFKDQNPDLAPVAVMMIYNAPPFAIIGRKSLGVMAPKDLEGRILGAPAPDGAYAQWKAFVKANDIDASKVTIENVGFPVREPMLAAGKVDAITGYSFSSYINLKAKGVGEGGHLAHSHARARARPLRQRHHRQSGMGEGQPGSGEGVRGGHSPRIPGDGKGSRERRQARAQPQRRGTRGGGAGTAADWRSRRTSSPTRCARTDSGGVDMERLERSIDQIADTYEFTNRPAAADVFDSQYLSSKAERMIP